MNAPMRRCKSIVFWECRKGRSKPRKNINKVIRHDLETLGLTEDITQDRKLSRFRIKVANLR